MELELTHLELINLMQNWINGIECNYNWQNGTDRMSGLHCHNWLTVHHWSLKTNPVLSRDYLLKSIAVFWGIIHRYSVTAAVTA